jgi:hypothetical protein
VQTAGRRLQVKQEVAERWRDRLALSREEREALAQRPGHRGPIDAGFFAALEKVGRIRGDCQVLLAAGHQPAALGTLDSMAEVEEAAMDRLYRWGLYHTQIRFLDLANIQNRWAQSSVRSSELGENLAPLARAMFHLQVHSRHLSDPFLKY